LAFDCSFFYGALLDDEEVMGDGVSAGWAELDDHEIPIFSIFALAIPMPKSLIASYTFSPVLALTFSVV
jgi:hypothetical protein